MHLNGHDADQTSIHDIELVARTLGGLKARRTGTGWVTRCPAHDDINPSLSVSAGKDGRLLVRCHAGCSQEAVLAALSQRDIHVLGKRKAEKPDDTGNIAMLQRKGWQLIEAYDYRTADGILLYQNVRFEICDTQGIRHKTFRQRRPVGDGFVESLNGIPQVPYRLARIVEAPGQDIDCAEGEKTPTASHALD